MKNQPTLVTGCTSGIGLHLAREFAKRGHDLVLVAPVLSELELVAQNLKASYGTNSKVIPADLEKDDAPEEVFRAVQDAGIRIEILVNNAGHGFRGRFWENGIDKDVSMVALNVVAVLRLTKLFLPGMRAAESGRILNTASVAGFEPGPWMAVYHATKAFVLSWSEALAIELKDSGVTVTALCPGPTDTDFFPKANMENVFAFQKGNLMAPQEVAKAGCDGLFAEELFVVPGMMNKVLTAGRRILPQTTQAELNEKQYEEVPSNERKRRRGDLEHAAEAKA